MSSERRARRKHNKHQAVHCRHESTCRISARNEGCRVFLPPDPESNRLTNKFLRHARSNTSSKRKLFLHLHIPTIKYPQPLYKLSASSSMCRVKTFDAPSMQKFRVYRYTSTCRIGILCEKDASSSFVFSYAGQGRRLMILSHLAFVPGF